MEIEKKINAFYSQLNRLKDQSMLKKSKEQRMEIYLRLKREAEEKRRKEMEDKKNP